MNNIPKVTTKSSPFKGELERVRSGSVWLFLELIVITVVAWVVIDPAVVNLYYMNQPVGYDSDRLVLTEIKRIYNSDGTGSANAMEQMNEYLPRLVEKLKATDDIENVYGYENPYSALSHRYGGLRLICCREHDTIGIYSVTFCEGQHFFETYGLRPLPGSPSTEELSELTSTLRQVVLSESAAKAIFGTTEGVVGRSIAEPGQGENTPPMTVAGVVEDVQHERFGSSRSTLYAPSRPSYYTKYLVLRLRKGVKPARYVEEHAGDVMALAKTPFIRISKIMPYEDSLLADDLQDGLPQETNMHLALALFFLINLSLAVIGTVWLQAKRRTEECGVRRAFGATKPRLLLSFLAEGALMATVAIVIGCIIYLNYAHSGYYETQGGFETFNMYTSQLNMPPLSDLTWVDHFWPHFLIVSACVYIIILCTVLIGTTIPALKILGTKITDALREE
ncbi:MAG: ABC transporter permease [Bacteroidaceae bacterium]|nr:ABC transporter permease [Bacteroidaceae bacterium]